MAHTGSVTVDRLVDMVRTAEVALRRASQAALAEDGNAAERELAAAELALKPLHEELEDEASTLLTGWGPSPEGVRAIVAEAHVGGDVQQLTELARQVGEIAWARRAGRPLPEPLRAPLRGMSALALEMVGRAADALAEPQPEAVADLHSGLNDVGRRQRLLYDRLVSADPPPERADAVDAVLLSCCFERCASHALSAARHAALFGALP